uniref:Uncharacterized protein n=1 Tax=Candidatus Kentrum sp. FM TaxID=2126340 RepID=A0A450RWQ6_9GAMM|nr:MAG: hypothetical protein BECKFM1743A_GA0114220_1001021 [Candidatus Kentron sp. FM]VFJ44406.1 MAG: hypothetical protein BECKFM1743C_GA0114222_1001020 [Candidatus Kentron sp. FM]VFK06283.1 MAG: hypothetical protein BECKFM1743B_GA0114221_1001321 [Candidatus Kentron sp. FM]
MPVGFYCHFLGMHPFEFEIALVRRLDAGLDLEKRKGKCGRVLSELLVKVAEQRDRARSWLRFARFHVRKEKGLRISAGQRRQAEEAREKLRKSEETLERYRP